MRARPERSSVAVKDHDSPVAVLLATRAASALLPHALRAGVSPNQLTLTSLAITLAAALLAGGSSASTPAAVAAALLIELGFVLDCLDGQVARSTGRTSDFGAYLDVMTDLVKGFAVVAGAAVAAGGAGAAALGGWALLWFVLCQHHVHVTRAYPQRTQGEYEIQAAPWKRRLVAFGQRIDVAFAIGEFLTVIAIGILFGRPGAALLVVAVVLPIQFLSYAVRFWKHRYQPGGGVDAPAPERRR